MNVFRSLIYTSIADIPSWAKEFKQLEALYDLKCMSCR